MSPSLISTANGFLLLRGKGRRGVVVEGDPKKLLLLHVLSFWVMAEAHLGEDRGLVIILGDV